MDDEERTARLIEKQIARAQASAKHREVCEATELQRQEEDDKVAFNFSGGGAKAEKVTAKSVSWKSFPFFHHLLMSCSYKSPKDKLGAFHTRAVIVYLCRNEYRRLLFIARHTILYVQATVMCGFQALVVENEVRNY